MEEMQHSEITGRDYSPKDCVFIFNVRQATKYITHGAPLEDVFVSKDKLCFVFTRTATFHLYKAWCGHTLE